MARQITLLEGDTGQKISSLEVLAGGVLAPATTSIPVTVTAGAVAGTTDVQVVGGTEAALIGHGGLLGVALSPTGSVPSEVAVGGARVTDVDTGDYEIRLIVQGGFGGGDADLVLLIL